MIFFNEILRFLALFLLTTDQFMTAEKENPEHT